MNFIATAVRWRHGTFVLFCLLAIFGVIALFQLPLELQPGGDRPEITITTPYAGAAPAEVETLITRPIEEQMEEVLGVKEIRSSSQNGRSRISLEFNDANKLDSYLLDVINRLQQVRNLPAEAGESTVQKVGANSAPMMWVVMVPQAGAQSNPDRYRDLIEEIILPRLRRIEGVGDFIQPGGRGREVEVIIDPLALSARGLTISDVVQVLQQNNRDVRGGPLVVGRREYRVRTVSRSTNFKQLEDFVLRRDPAGTVLLRDVARVQIGRTILDSKLLFWEKKFPQTDHDTAAIGIIRQVGANVPKLSQDLRSAFTELEKQFQQAGDRLTFSYNYDESEYITQSLQQVEGNLISGAILATIVLILFLGSLRTVAVVTLTIPVASIIVFLVMNALGRSLNIITLAGISFSVGMVIDNSIVVTESIFNHLQQGKSPITAAIDGTKEVGGAMLGSTLTNVVVFLPLILVTGEAGRLYYDIAIVLTASNLLSLLAAITLVPMLAGLFLDQTEAQQVLERSLQGRNWLERSVSRTSAIFQLFQGRLESFLMATVAWSTGSGRLLRRLLVLAIPTGLMAVSIFLLPPPDYLPDGNRNLILWRVEPVPGTSVAESIRQSEPLRNFLKKQPEVQRVMFIDRPGNRAIATILNDRDASNQGLANMVSRLRQEGNNFAGYRSMVPSRVSIFRDPGKEFRINLVGEDLDELSKLDKSISNQLRELPGVRNVRSDYVSGAGELQILPRRERLAEVGINEAELGSIVEAALGGRLASQFVDGKEELDVTVQLQDTAIATPADLQNLALYSTQGQRLQLSDLAAVVETTGPDVINHVDLERSIGITVSLADNAPLGALVKQTEQNILAPLRQNLAPGYLLKLAGSADQLALTVNQLSNAFVFAILVTYLLLVALYKSFLYPVVILATVPIGMSGSLLSLVLANKIPGVNAPLDMITALGFVILTGIVVNNAIIIVDRALQLQEEGVEFDGATYQATRERLRAVFMTAGTSVLGILPLAIVPGKGSELYQGLGIVLAGGLAFSTILTPTVVPALMGLLHDLSGQRQKVTKSQLVAQSYLAQGEIGTNDQPISEQN